jgi:hypothetical protein
MKSQMFEELSACWLFQAPRSIFKPVKWACRKSVDRVLFDETSVLLGKYVGNIVENISTNWWMIWWGSGGDGLEEPLSRLRKNW